MTFERQEELRKRIAAELCEGCRHGHPFDEQGRHVHEYKQEAFGDIWDSTSWLPCNATPARVQSWLIFVLKEIAEEKPAPAKSRKKGIR